MATKTISHPGIEVKCGFSLLELLTVLAVMAILLTLAVPAYRQYTQRVERADAVRLLLAIAGCQAHLRANTGFYDTTQCIDGLDNESYRFKLQPEGDTSAHVFEAFAEPKSSEGNDCGVLSLDHSGTRGISSGSGKLSACWSGR